MRTADIGLRSQRRFTLTRHHRHVAFREPDQTPGRGGRRHGRACQEQREVRARKHRVIPASSCALRALGAGRSDRPSVDLCPTRSSPEQCPGLIQGWFSVALTQQRVSVCWVPPAVGFERDIPIHLPSCAQFRERRTAQKAEIRRARRLCLNGAQSASVPSSARETSGSLASSTASARRSSSELRYSSEGLAPSASRCTS